MCGALVLVFVGTNEVVAQNSVGPVAEARLDFIAGRSTAAQMGAALSLGSGYGRLFFAAGLGAAWKDGARHVSSRVDIGGRFLLDPLQESRWGLYGTGGLSVLNDGHRRWRGLLVAGVGLEFPSRGRGVWAAEVGLGGGLRLGIALRQSRRGRR
jgi:hypothetical protein